MAGIFISHSHGDQPIADALAGLVNDLFGNKVTVHYSSKKERDGSIPPGEDWFRWIVEQVRQTDIAFVLLTSGIHSETLGHLGGRSGRRRSVRDHGRKGTRTAAGLRCKSIRYTFSVCSRRADCGDR